MENKEFEELEGKLEQEQTKEKRKISKLSIFLIILAIITVLALILTCVGVVYIKETFNYKYNELSDTPEELGVEEVLDDEIINIALFGLDTENETSFKGRSDSIMILSVNKTDKKIKLISVLRDSLVPMLYKGEIVYDKINSAYAKGGPELAVKTLNNAFALDITEYATVNFSGMANIIDGIGGVDVTLTENELSHINSTVHDQAKKYGGDYSDYKLTSSGEHCLNGIQAVEYSRIRYVSNAQGTTNDYGRTDRQRYVMEQMFKKAITMEKTRYISLIKALSPYCETSLSYTEILSLAVEVLLNSPTFEENRVPSTEYTMKAPSIGVGSTVYYDLEFAANIIHAFIYEDIKPEDYIAKNGISKKDWYKEGYTPPVIKNVE